MGTTKKARPLLILLAEDNRSAVYVVRKSLEEHGIEHELAVVSDGEAAFRFFDEVETGAPAPDVIILDLNLPRRSGQEVLERLRTRGCCKDVPVVILSSSDSPVDRAAALGLGANAYFRKPTQLDDFLQLGVVVRDVVAPTRRPGEV
jgi:CheY-like chemotaxis protein